MIIKVTANDLKKGLRLNHRKCPVALALTRAGFKEVSVGLGTATAKGRERIELPQEAAVFINAFDWPSAATSVAAPFSFSIPWRKPVVKKKAVVAKKKKTAKK